MNNSLFSPFCRGFGGIISRCILCFSLLFSVSFSFADDSDYFSLHPKNPEGIKISSFASSFLDSGTDPYKRESWIMEKTKSYDLFGNQIYNILVYADIYYDSEHDKKKILNHRKLCLTFEDINNKNSQIKISIIDNNDFDIEGGVDNCFENRISLSPIPYKGLFSIFTDGKKKYSIDYFVEDNIIKIDSTNKDRVLSSFEDDVKSAVTFDFQLNSENSPNSLYAEFFAFNLNNILDNTKTKTND